MSKTTIEIPDSYVEALAPYKDRFGELLLLGLSQMRIQEALLLYQRGAVSFGRAAEIAMLSEEELTRIARAMDVIPRWSKEMAVEELR